MNITIVWKTRSAQSQIDLPPKEIPKNTSQVHGCLRGYVVEVDAVPNNVHQRPEQGPGSDVSVKIHHIVEWKNAMQHC